MAIYFHLVDVKFHVEHKLRIKQWLKNIAKDHGFKAGDINIILQNDETQLRLNRESLKHDTYTDIITFNYNDGKRINGDLFISIDRIRENAVKFAVPNIEELHRVIAHGVLHLIGFNDKTDEQSQQMRAEETKAIELYKHLFHVKHD